MCVSNIIGESNIYPCIDNPLRDQAFIEHIEDYGYLQKIHKTQRIEATGFHFTKKQLQLLEIEMRCVYAKNDPCWGYIDGEGISCRCIESKCPQIYGCNPTFSLEQKKNWTMNVNLKELYGYPEKQKKFYLVDLVSDEEMLRYISDPKGDGIEHSIMIDSESDKSKQMDGRRLVIIGYEDTYFGDADNQLSPIWGYVDDTEENGVTVKNKYGKTKEIINNNTDKYIKEELAENEEKIEAVFVNPEEEFEETPSLDAKKIEEYNEILNKKTDGAYQLTELNHEVLKKISHGKVLNILLSNEAEMSYVSGMLLQVGIRHSIEELVIKEAVNLWTADSSKLELHGEALLISNSFAEQACKINKEYIWNELLNSNIINQLIITGREFFEFFDKNNSKRWGCRNLYGATHLALRLKDLLVKSDDIKEQEITLVRDRKHYIVLSSSNAEKLGVSSSELWNVLDCLKKCDEIVELPSVISGLYLSKSGTDIVLKGIGHMRFDEY